MKKGFTLIELLIVVAIIGILAVALVPTITDAPARARDAGRKATVNSVVTAIEAFNLDNGRYPGGKFCLDDAAAAGDEGLLATALGGNLPSGSPTPDTSVCGGEYIRYEALDSGYQVFMSVEKTGNYAVSGGYANADVAPSATYPGGDALDGTPDGAGGTAVDVFGIVRGS